MAKSDKELKPLLNRHNNQQQQHNIPQKKQVNRVKGDTMVVRPKLVSVSENSVDSDQSSKESRNDQCSEKDVDEAEIKKSKRNPTANLSATNPTHSHGQILVEDLDNESAKHQCAHNPFGVRSYLHHFYESVSQTPDENYQYLIQPKGSNCGAVWFKIGLIVGSTLFLLGAIAIVIGYAIPKQRVIMGVSDTIEVIDNDARRFNENLDRCKLIGLAGFCSGGLILVISLLSPTLTSTYWDTEPPNEPFRVSLSSSNVLDFVPGPGALGPMSEKGSSDVTARHSATAIPVTEKIKCIQPVWTD